MEEPHFTPSKTKNSTGTTNKVTHCVSTCRHNALQSTHEKERRPEPVEPLYETRFSVPPCSPGRLRFPHHGMVTWRHHFFFHEDEAPLQPLSLQDPLESDAPRRWPPYDPRFPQLDHRRW